MEGSMFSNRNSTDGVAPFSARSRLLRRAPNAFWRACVVLCFLSVPVCGPKIGTGLGAVEPASLGSPIQPPFVKVPETPSDAETAKMLQEALRRELEGRNSARKGTNGPTLQTQLILAPSQVPGLMDANGLTSTNEIVAEALHRKLKEMSDIDWRARLLPGRNTNAIPS